MAPSRAVLDLSQPRTPLAHLPALSAPLPPPQDVYNRGIEIYEKLIPAVANLVE